MRIFTFLVVAGSLAGGGYYVDKKYPHIRQQVMEFISTGKFHTLEAHFSPEQIMELHRKELLKDENHAFLEPYVKFHPYLLMEVKYTSHNSSHTGEGIILWDMIDGEMVVNTKNWEKTHGFGDCIKAGVNRSEFKVLNLLAKRGGALDREGLSRALHVENEIIDGWIENCRRKKLVVQSGNLYRLHLQSPKLSVVPETQIANRLVTQTFKNAARLPKRFSSTQIKRIAQSAFGPDFAIRNTVNVFLPICTITVQNPDGSLHTSYWNALNGKELSFCSLIE